jgi:hypothetical protein
MDCSKRRFGLIYKNLIITKSTTLSLTVSSPSIPHQRQQSRPCKSLFSIKMAAPGGPAPAPSTVAASSTPAIITQPPPPASASRDGRIHTHSHIKGLGLADDGTAMEQSQGFVGQRMAREVSRKVASSFVLTTFRLLAFTWLCCG